MFEVQLNRTRQLMVCANDNLLTEKVGNKNFRKCGKLKRFQKDNDETKFHSRRIMSRLISTCPHKFLYLLPSYLSFKSVRIKIKIDKSVSLPVALYGCKT
jgi:hypothetical protein